MTPRNEHLGAGGDLLEEVRDATSALTELAKDDGVLRPGMIAALRATCDDVTRRLTSKELAILLVGPSDGGKRTLVNVAVGTELLRPEAREPAGVVRVRHGEDAHYVCELREGRTESLPSALREKTRLLDEALARAERELAEAERELGDLRHRASELRGRVEETRLTGQPSFEAWVRRIGRRIASWFSVLLAVLFTRGASFWRRLAKKPSGERTLALPVAEAAKAAPPTLTKEERFERIMELERALLAAEPRLEEAKQTLARARDEQRAHAAERARVFFDDVRALTDADARGGEIADIAIDHPAEILPPGLVLVDAPGLAQADEGARDATWHRIRDDLGGCIVVSPGGRANVLAPDLLARIAPIMPHGVRGLVHGVGSGAEAHRELGARLRAELPPLFARIREESPTLVAAFTTRAVCDRLHVLTQACAITITELETQIAELEERRVAITEHLRTRTQQRMAAAVDEAARTVLERGRSTLRTRINDLGDEWRDEISACEDRAGVDACIGHINASAPERLRKLCDGLADQIARDAQAAGDRLQRALLDELRVAQQDSTSARAAAAVVLGDAPAALAEDVAPSVPGAPLAATHDAFERKRVGIGIGGAAAGAALGTLIFPGIGTAVGAMVGVLAGFVEGTGALKRRAIEHVRTHGAAIEKEILVRLDGAAANMARDLALSLGDVLEGAIARREGALAAVFEDSDRAIEEAQGKLEELARVRGMLVTHEQRFVSLAGRARADLQALTAARGRSPAP